MAHRKIVERIAALLFAVVMLAAFSANVLGASTPAVEAKSGMVVSSQHLASKIGVEILKQGGNAVDAAVAVGYAQAVVNPCCGNLGGGGFRIDCSGPAQPDSFLQFWHGLL